MTRYHVIPRARIALASLAAIALLALAGCGSSNSSSSSSAGASASSSSAPAASSSSGSSGSTGSTGSSGASSTDTSSCGPKKGVKATGSEIVLGAINTKQPGTDFTDISNMENAYWACVNANGGVNGHPVKLIGLTDATNPSQVAADANQLVHTDHVVGVAGVSDIIECSINHATWEKLGYKVIAAGIAPECYSTPNYADVNMGPRYSSDGAVQYVLSQHVSKVVFDQSNVPGTGYIAAGPIALAGAAHVPIKTETDNVPINDANSVALRLVQDAGSGGAVVLNFTPPEALVILQAAQKLGLEDRVKLWSCSTPCNTDFLAKALGPKWEGKFFVNSELTPPDAVNTPKMNLYKAILKQYGKNVTGGIGAFSQMGFTIAEIAQHALESVKGPYTVKSVNQAFENVKNFNTGMICQSWTYGPYPLHIANNVDYTVTPKNGQMQIAKGCTAISAVDPNIAQYRKVAGTAPLDPTSGGSS